MKDPKDIVACCVDRGVFYPVAKRLAKEYRRVFYCNPDGAYSENFELGTKGDGHPDVHLVEDYWRIKNEVDVWVFADCTDVGAQLELRSQGRAVWGSMAVSDLERFRGQWLDYSERLDSPMPETRRIVGVSKLRAFLKRHENEEWFVKVSRWRGDCWETWKATEPAQVAAKLDLISFRAGPLKEQVTFYVQKKLNTDLEGGADTYNVLGKWPGKIVLGWEKKGESYLAVVKDRADMPPQIWNPMERITPLLEAEGYTNFISSEIRIKDDTSWWLDPCFRTPSPAGEEQLLLYTNFPLIVAAGANGELVEPELAGQFCGEAVIEYNGERDGWKSFEIPDSVKEFVTLYAHAYADGAVHFGPSQDPVAIGCAVGIGDTAQEVIDHLHDIQHEMRDCPVTLHVESMSDLLVEINKAQEQGIDFAEEVPEPAAVLADE